MASSSASKGFLPCSQCSSAIPSRRLPQTGHVQHSWASSSYALGTIRLFSLSPHRVCKYNVRNVETNAQFQNSGAIGDDAPENTNYVAMRTYRKALASLRVTGEALPWQVNAAMAADGGRTAAEELVHGRSMLAIETFVPGRFSEDSSVSTKLQAPTRKVLERANSINRKDKENSRSGRAFAIAFQAVRLLKLRKFELCFYRPGTSRDMDHDVRKADIVGFLEVLDPSLLQDIAKAVSKYALSCVQEKVHEQVVVQGLWTKLFQPWKKSKQVTIDSPAVRICTLSESESESEVLAHMDMIVQGESFMGTKMGLRRRAPWWERMSSVRLKGLDPEMLDEFVPTHELEFRLPSPNFKVGGCLQKTSNNKCRVHLTHVQMIDLADVLDMYCGDQYTGPGVNLCTDLDITVPKRSWSKLTQTIWVGALASAIGGALILGMLSVSKLRGRETSTSVVEMSFLEKLRETHRNQEPVMPTMDNISQGEMDTLCGLVVAMVKDAFGWPHEIETSDGNGAWMGTNLTQSARTPLHDEVEESPEASSTIQTEIPSSQEDILLYQVLMSRDGRVLGFQPGSLNAINTWAIFPYSKFLHKRQNHGAGFFEQGLKYSGRPDNCVVLELLVRDSPTGPAATARPYVEYR